MLEADITNVTSLYGRRDSADMLFSYVANLRDKT